MSVLPEPANVADLRTRLCTSENFLYLANTSYASRWRTTVCTCSLNLNTDQWTNQNQRASGNNTETPLESAAFSHTRRGFSIRRPLKPSSRSLMFKTYEADAAFVPAGIANPPLPSITPIRISRPSC
jgi:hypothetical protein